MGDFSGMLQVGGSHELKTEKRTFATIAVGHGRTNSVPSANPTLAELESRQCIKVAGPKKKWACFLSTIRVNN